MYCIRWLQAQWTSENPIISIQRMDEKWLPTEKYDVALYTEYKHISITKDFEEVDVISKMTEDLEEKANKLGALEEKLEKSLKLISDQSEVIENLQKAIQEKDLIIEKARQVVFKKGREFSYSEPQKSDLQKQLEAIKSRR